MRRSAAGRAPPPASRGGVTTGGCSVRLCLCALDSRFACEINTTDLYCIALTYKDGLPYATLLNNDTLRFIFCQNTLWNYGTFCSTTISKDTVNIALRRMRSHFHSSGVAAD